MSKFVDARLSLSARAAMVPAATIASTVFLLATGAGLGLVMPVTLVPPYDAIFHAVFFALLTVSLSGFFQGRAVPALVAAAIFAVAGELVQGVIPYRMAAAMDLVPGLVGAISAAGVLSIKIPVSLPAEELGFVERARATHTPIVD